MGTKCRRGDGAVELHRDEGSIVEERCEGCSCVGRGSVE